MLVCMVCMYVCVTVCVYVCVPALGKKERKTMTQKGETVELEE